MMTDHITAEQKACSPFFPGFWQQHGWGFGGAVTTGPGEGAGSIGSYGWVGGFGTGFLIDPNTGMTTIVMTQRLMRGPDDATLIERVQTFACQAFA